MIISRGSVYGTPGQGNSFLFDALSKVSEATERRRQERLSVVAGQAEPLIQQFGWEGARARNPEAVDSYVQMLRLRGQNGQPFGASQVASPDQLAANVYDQYARQMFSGQPGATPLPNQNQNSPVAQNAAVPLNPTAGGVDPSNSVTNVTPNAAPNALPPGAVLTPVGQQLVQTPEQPTGTVTTDPEQQTTPNVRRNPITNLPYTNSQRTRPVQAMVADAMATAKFPDDYATLTDIDKVLFLESVLNAKERMNTVGHNLMRSDPMYQQAFLQRQQIQTRINQGFQSDPTGVGAAGTPVQNPARTQQSEEAQRQRLMAEETNGTPSTNPPDPATAMRDRVAGSAVNQAPPLSALPPNVETLPAQQQLLMAMQVKRTLEGQLTGPQLAANAEYQRALQTMEHNGVQPTRSMTLRGLGNLGAPTNQPDVNETDLRFAEQMQGQVPFVPQPTQSEPGGIGMPSTQEQPGADRAMAPLAAPPVSPSMRARTNEAISQINTDYARSQQLASMTDARARGQRTQIANRTMRNLNEVVRGAISTTTFSEDGLLAQMQSLEQMYSEQPELFGVLFPAHMERRLAQTASMSETAARNAQASLFSQQAKELERTNNIIAQALAPNGRYGNLTRSQLDAFVEGIVAQAEQPGVANNLTRSQTELNRQQALYLVQQAAALEASQKAPEGINLELVDSLTKSIEMLSGLELRQGGSDLIATFLQALTTAIQRPMDIQVQRRLLPNAAPNFVVTPAGSVLGGTNPLQLSPAAAGFMPQP